MCNVTIAKNKLKTLKARTEKDIYVLEFESMEVNPLNEDTFFKVKMICNDNNLSCPLYKYSGVIQFKKTKDIFKILHTLASKYGIFLDYTKLTE
jgi:hypothetical protein